MLNPTCAKCGAGLAAGARFCRQCGEPLDDADAPADSREATTRTLVASGGVGGAATHRLEPRPTRPNYQAPGESSARGPSSGDAVARPRRRTALVRNLLMAVAAAVVAVSVVAVLMSRSQEPAGGALIYPGAETVVDLKGDEGSTLHLRTRDAFDDVLRWYVANLKPTKTMRISETSVILKASGRTVTIVADGDAVNVVIKGAA